MRSNCSPRHLFGIPAYRAVLEVAVVRQQRGAGGAHVEHWLNGVKVVEYELWTPDWERRVAASKFKDFPKYARARRGRIGLQDHGDRVAFRNIRIREL